jgi:hypothetical protein
MKPSPENLEKFIHQTLRAQPNRTAPRSLESRVMAAIAARAALPWWRQSFMQWPVAARCAFILLSIGLVKLALMATVWAVGGFHESAIVTQASAHFGWAEAIIGGLKGVGESFTLVLRNIPSMWIYGILASIAAVYATLFSLGATAYRVLYSNRG